MRLHKTLATGLMVMSMGAMSLSSYAQATPGEGPQDRPAISAEKMAKFEKEKARREAELHDRLKITAAQEDAWKTYLKSEQFPPKPGDRRLQKDERTKLTTP